MRLVRLPAVALPARKKRSSRKARRGEPYHLKGHDLCLKCFRNSHGCGKAAPATPEEPVMAVPTVQELADLVKRMRDKQTEYFTRGRQLAVLQEARDLERRVDEAVQKVRGEYTPPLFSTDEQEGE